MLGAPPPSESRNTAFHCAKRAGGQFTVSPPLFSTGPAHGLPFFSALDVIPWRTYNATLPLVAPFSPQVRRPQCENIFASNVWDSKLPCDSNPGPSVNILPGLAVATKILPPGPDKRLVTCAEAVLATLEKTSFPSSSMIAPLLPVPSSSLPPEDRTMANTRSSRELHSVSGEPSVEIFTVSAPPVVEGK